MSEAVRQRQENALALNRQQVLFDMASAVVAKDTKVAYRSMRVCVCVCVCIPSAGRRWVSVLLRMHPCIRMCMYACMYV